jgi:hypothetical protein
VGERRQLRSADAQIAHRLRDARAVRRCAPQLRREIRIVGEALEDVLGNDRADMPGHEASSAAGGVAARW